MDTKLIEYVKIKRPKFVHLFRYCGIFSDSFIKFINSNEKLKASDSIFILNSDNNSYSDNQNIFCTKDLEHNEADYINFLSNYVEIIFIHFLDIWTILKLSKESRQKIIWRTWGNDLYKTISYSPSLKLKLRHIAERFLWTIKGRKIVNQFKFIGISSSECDLLILKRMHISTKSHVLPYPVISNNLTPLQPDNHINKKIRVMIGHSSNSSLHHIKWIKCFSRFPDQFSLFVPLAYGRENYKNKVVNYLNSISQIEYVLLENKTSIDEYTQMLNNVDIAVFDCKNQMALGNIIILLGLGKTVYLNKQSVVLKTLLNKNISVGSTNELRGCNFEKIKEKIAEDKTNGIEYSRKIYNNDFVLEQWESLFENL